MLCLQDVEGGASGMQALPTEAPPPYNPTYGAADVAPPTYGQSHPDGQLRLSRYHQYSYIYVSSLLINKLPFVRTLLSF